MEIIDRNLTLAREAWTDARAAGVPVVEWDKLLWSFDVDLGKKCWGRCKRLFNASYRISLGRNLMKTSQNAILNTIIHELVHTVAYNHGRMFKFYASKINSFFPNKYHVSRFTTEAEKGLSREEIIAAHRYAIECPCCGKIYVYDRMARAVKEPEHFFCTPCFRSTGVKRYLKRVK